MKAKTPLHLPVVSITLLLLNACSTTPERYSQKHDTAPEKPIDVTQVADAIPRNEPYSRYGNPVSYKVFGKTYYTLKSSKDYVARGTASWYGTKFHGHRTSSGETYDMYAMTAAHKTLPLPTYARVTNLDNKRSVVVKINDRGPFHDNRLIDLSYTAASRLGILEKGTGLVEVRALEAGDMGPDVQRVKAGGSQPRAAVIPAHTTLPATSSGVNSSLYLQLGAFSVASNARNLQRKLAESNFEGVFITEAVNNDKPVYRVRIGPLENSERAKILSNRLKTHGIVSPRVVID